MHILKNYPGYKVKCNVIIDDCFVGKIAQVKSLFTRPFFLVKIMDLVSGISYSTHLIRCEPVSDDLLCSSFTHWGCQCKICDTYAGTVNIRCSNIRVSFHKFGYCRPGSFTFACEIWDRRRPFRDNGQFLVTASFVALPAPNKVFIRVSSRALFIPWLTLFTGMTCWTIIW